MEIIDYLKAARRRAWLLILLPLLSAGAAAGLLLYAPPTYTSTATVDAPALVGGTTAQYTGSQGVIQFVSSFQATAGGPVVREGVIDRNPGVTLTELTEQLTVVQRGGSSSMAVTFVSEDKAEVEAVVEAVTSLTLRQMFASQVESAAARVEDATASVAEANKALGTFTAAHKMADPQKAYEAQLNRVNGMVQQQAAMRAAGNAVGAAAMASPIAAASAALDQFAPILNQYSALTVARDSAIATLNAAKTGLSSATTQLEAADPAKVVAVSEARAVDRMNALIRAVIAVGAAAFFLALLLVLMIEVVNRARRQAAAESAAGRNTGTESPNGRHAADPVNGTPLPQPIGAHEAVVTRS